MDEDGDGKADMISWPRIKEMPTLTRPFPKDVQEKADEVVLGENYILDYLAKNK